MMRVSVIVPVRNEAASIERVLDGLREQDLPADRFEVLVVDGCSDDETVAVVRRVQHRFPNLKLFHNPQRLSSAARNIAVRHMTGDCCVVVDGHTVLPDRTYLSNVLSLFESTGADSLARPQPLTGGTLNRFQQHLAVARKSWLGHNPDSAIFSDQPGWVEPQNVAVAYRRQVFEKVGLFDPRFDACEDVEFNTRVHKAGMTCWFAPELRLEYKPRASLPGLFHQLQRYGRGRARLATQDASTVTLPGLAPTVFLVWILTGAVCGLFSPMIGMLWVLSVAGYMAVVLGESFRLSRKSPGKGIAMFLTIFPAIHFGFAWGMLSETFSLRRRMLTAT